MEILDYFTCAEPERWLDEIRLSDWGAGQYLHQLLAQGQLCARCGEGARLFLLTDGARLVSFCTLSPRDDVPDAPFGPWIGFVYTFPAYRGHRYAGRLLDHACAVALRGGASHAYVSTTDTGLYEAYGFEFLQTMRNRHGEPARIYRKTLRTVLRADASRLDALCGLMRELWPRHNAEEGLRETRSLLAAPHCAFFLAMESGEAVGFAQAQLRYDYVEGASRSPVGYLEGIYVRDGHRLRGHGSALLAACERWAAEKGCPEFASDCELDNEDSLAFHLRFGFAEVSRNIHFLKSTENFPK